MPNSSLPADIAAICQQLTLPATAAQVSALAGYVELLERWNGTYNLSAVRTRPAILTQHVADCLAVVAPLQRQAACGAMLDVGSGGGLPGVVLAIMLPAVQVTCVDAVAKKAAFVQQVAGALRLPNLVSVHGRAEALRRSAYDVIASRAFSSLANFVALTESSLAAGGVWLAMKGQVPLQEIAALPGNTTVFHVEQLQVPGLDAQRCLVWMRRAPGQPQSAGAAETGQSIVGN